MYLLSKNDSFGYLHRRKIMFMSWNEGHETKGKNISSSNHPVLQTDMLVFRGSLHIQICMDVILGTRRSWLPLFFFATGARSFGTFHLRPTQNYCTCKVGPEKEKQLQAGGHKSTEKGQKTNPSKRKYHLKRPSIFRGEVFFCFSGESCQKRIQGPWQFWHPLLQNESLQKAFMVALRKVYEYPIRHPAIPQNWEDVMQGPTAKKITLNTEPQEVFAWMSRVYPRKLQHTPTPRAIPRSPFMKGIPKYSLLVKVAWGVFQRCVETTLEYIIISSYIYNYIIIYPIFIPTAVHFSVSSYLRITTNKYPGHAFGGSPMSSWNFYPCRRPNVKGVIPYT